MAETLGSFLTRRIGDEIALLREFIAVLRLEQDALMQDDADAIHLALQRKGTLANDMGQVSTDWSLALARAGFSADRAGLDAFITQQVDASTLVRLRAELLDLATQANEINTLNGSLIHARMRHNQQALAILLGSREAAPLYGSDGRSKLATSTTSGRRYSGR